MDRSKDSGYPQPEGSLKGAEMDKKNARPQTAGTSATSKRDSIGSNTAEAQRKRLLEALRNGSISTLEARRNLDILSPAPRVLELRRAGHPILTNWTHEPSDCGKLHRVARYVLMAKGA